MTLKAWREVINPHEDVLVGDFQEASFAADLTKVVAGVAPPEYQDPVRFFERTVITEGMSLLLQSVVRRLAGKGGDPVVQLQTSFGGGKTHTMMAVLHVASGKAAAKDMPGVAEMLSKAKVKELTKGNVAVLDGNALSPSQPRDHGKVKANTMWGELAWQLGREDGYALVADADKDGTSPGKEALSELFNKFGPAVVLIDEAVAYIRQFHAGKSYKGGTYNSNLSFLQALTEAASRVPNAMVLGSLPDSLMEVGDEQGQQTLDSVQKIFGRIEAVWKPVGAEEAFEIVRRRLFGTVQDEGARNDVCQAFAALYTKDAEKFPSDSRDAAYLRRMKASYPVHPEIFDRLYGDWATLPKFQRTRGVLRLMARLVHSLWTGNNKDPLILPGSIPLDDLAVRNELVKYLPAGWDSIVDKDVDGANAEPRRLDDEAPSTLGALQACRRAARTIFLGSAPSVSAQKVRGVGVERVRLGCAQPGESIGRYDDALKRLGDRLHYLYAGNDRFWFDNRTNLRREMEDRLQRIDLKLQLYPEIETRLQKAVKSNVCSAVHVFADGKDVPDKVDLRLYVLDPDQSHKRKDPESKAIKAAAEILAKHGEKPREYKNRILFLAPDGNAVQTLRDQVRRYLAWKSIVDDADQLNLDKHHDKESKKNLDEASARVDASIRETYRLLLAPMQEPDANGGISPVVWEDEALPLSGSSYDKAIEATTRDKEWVIKSWAPTHLQTLLSKWFWRDGATAKTQKVWLDMCRYLYFPRLVSVDTFTQAVKDGIPHKTFFGYAAAEKEPGTLEGLLFGSSGGVYLDEQAVLVRPDVAEKSQAKSTDSTAGNVGSLTPSADPPALATAAKVAANAPAQQVYRRFHGTVDLEAGSPVASFTQLVDDIVLHFISKLGVEVSITVDVEARFKDGFDVSTVRTVRENAKVLKFKTAEFEEE